ncbi:hypothetical protein A3H80_03205 [Candidatus Roizmanbacteria bacterium RIFCSPLOWO2_02_FULL_37_19]|uniref:DUF4446 domain-containing protein n=1 Tax=Candidatus Roizmanbacteria bacterium RIFCSPHIGHO2_02_FULL_37_24 TaxID=1802037 RepID=A0A1F7GZY8_9BACT|nr:MAG: hypothetical protein A2862_04285 [Candidatus Roizmanbacteria bacterium RIFCSPHIGHO2_01_FULL_38_41]OGK24707.1 MAG: hypothetical protein A3C24_01120 [Candidatus Roizmanbacteria bacterium RIFCSPHIGHO2_02_FULL_37_24]OGK33226.1 MAG: hypothetical protein A3E10_03720 [Candidatus Roizmanbacteria bacterium RIFCSPHIGHO2_12_FULL_37_23]OGK44098.1 MAG: hypothetical protein A2956_03545 [Candidatus Roizmanbacteria bacterium RIFCSPLOWO2_01_FULL_37_57]OGK54098.1 MAG: hypothetical protein A3H80_03205 [Ca
MVVVYTAYGIALLWLIIISFFLFKTRKHYHNLTKRTNSKSIDDILDTILKENSNHEKDIKEIRNTLDSLEKESKTYYQKIGVVRFNPFERVGGDQSFVIAFLDKEDTGIVINFLYTREGVRIYIKDVKQGKPDKFELSQEEMEAIKKAS